MHFLFYLIVCKLCIIFSSSYLPSLYAQTPLTTNKESSLPLPSPPRTKDSKPQKISTPKKLYLYLYYNKYNYCMFIFKNIYITLSIYGFVEIFLACMASLKK